jgi:phage gpG-like protein
VTIPARPFLGLSAQDRRDAVEAVEEIAEMDWSGRKGP